MTPAYSFILIVFLACLSGSSPAFGQMAGTYTIGGADPDFGSLQSALSALGPSGTSDTVLFLVRNGNYNLPNQDDVTPYHPVIVQSESQSADSVTIMLSGSSLTFHSCGNLIFRDLYFKVPSGGWSGLDFSYCENIWLENCVVDAVSGLRMSYLSGAFGLTGNTILGELDINGFVEGNIEYNTITGQTSLPTAGIERIAHNTFGMLVRLPGHVDVYDNHFGGQVKASHRDWIFFFNNTVEGNLSFSFGSIIRVYANEVNGYFSAGFIDNILVAHNLFYDGVSIGHLDGNERLRFLYNNIAPDGHCGMVYSDNIEVIGNNFPDAILFQVVYPPEDATTISNNNYYPGYGVYGQNMYHIDPQYVAPDSLRATHPSLVGKGIPLEFPDFDIEGNDRSDLFPTLGAHEYYQSVDTLHVTCGQSLRLLLPDLPLGGSYSWGPTSFMNNPHAWAPLVYPSENTTYYVSDTLTGLLDSVVVVVDPFELVMEPDDSVGCGYFKWLHRHPHNNNLVELSWIPDEVSLFGENLWYATPEEDTQYVLTVDHAVCGTFVDSVEVWVDPQPTARVHLSFISDWTYGFTDTSFCADSIHWYFGDGAESTQKNVVHTYDTVGVVTLMLLAMNDYAADTLTYSLYIPPNPIDATAEQKEKEELRIYPNPNDGLFTLETTGPITEGRIALYNIQGKCVFDLPVEGNGGLLRKQLDLRPHPPGTYLLHLRTEDRIFRKKILIQ